MLSVVRGIVDTAKQNAAAPALVTSTRTISYGDLLENVARISNHFADRGLKPRAKMFINVADPDLRLVIMIAAMHAGFIPFALLEIGDLGHEVDHDYIVGAPALHTPSLTPDVVIDQSVFQGRLSDPVLRDFPDQPPDALLYVGSTTGTTGRRKLLALTWGKSAASSARWRGVAGAGTPTAPQFMRYASGDRLLSTLGDVTFAGVGMVLQVLTVGGAFVRPSRDIQEMAKVMNAVGANRILTTPMTISEMMDGLDKFGLRCPSIKRITLTGSLIQRGLIERLEQHFDAEIVVGYGSSEAGLVSAGFVTAATYTPGYVGQISKAVRLVTSGTEAEPGTLAVVIDRETLTPYYVKGRLVANNDTFYTMPDLGYVKGSTLYLVGRDDEVFVFNGNKTAFSLIDGELRKMPDVKDVAVVSAQPIGDPLGLVIGVVGPREDDFAPLTAQVCARVKANAADHIRFVRLDQIPRNAMGKVDRKRILDAYQQQAAEMSVN